MTVTYDAMSAAFDIFRLVHPPRAPAFIRYPSDADPMTDADGLERLGDGAGHSTNPTPELPPLNKADLPAPPLLWVVRHDDVVHAEKYCAFGDVREATEVKHTNLTGGQAAYAGGEMMILNNDMLIVSGDSGRFGPRDDAEMHDVAVAFKHSGYTVYSMGFDLGTDNPSRSSPARLRC